MKRTKKLLALLLSLILVLSLAGCGGKKETEDNNKPADNAATTDGTEATDDAAATDGTEATDDAEDSGATVNVADKFEAFDFGGRTIKVATWFDVYYTSDHTKPDDNPSVSNVETAQMQIDNVRRIEQKYNCKIVFENITWDSVISSINTSIAAGTPDYDVYMADVQFGFPAIFNGLAQKLEDVAPANSDLFSEDHAILLPFKTDSLGGTYLFQNTQLQLAPTLIGYNKTMIEDLGLEDPQELYAKGEWTWDKFRELCKAGTRDTNGDGETDVYGFGSVHTETFQGFFISNGASIAGGRTEGLSSSAAIETLEFLNKLYNEDYSARPFQSDWNDNWYAWSQGKVMFWTGEPWLFGDAATKASDAGAPITFEYHVVPFPKGPSAPDDTPRTQIAGNWYFIPTGVKDADKIMIILEEYFGWHNGDPELRDDPEWLESLFLSQEDVDMVNLVGQTLVFDPYTLLSPWFDFNASVVEPVINQKSQTIAQAVEAAKGTLQTALDNYVYKNVK